MRKFFPIRVSTLRGDARITFDAYVRVAGKYILLCREGESFEGERLSRLRAKKLQKMFISEEQMSAYDAYINQNLRMAYEKMADKPLEIRAQIIHGALQAAGEDLIDDPASEEFYKVALESSKSYFKFLMTEPESLRPIIEMKNTDYNICHHGAVVAALAAVIAAEMGFAETRPMQMSPLTLGCLIHDIEHQYNNIDRSSPDDKLSSPEKIIFNRHAIDGEKRIAEYPFYDSLVRDIIRLHEERIDGSGQNGVREKDLDLMVMTAATANVFDHYILYEGLTPKDALKKMLIDKMGLLPLDCMKSLQSALKKRAVI